MALCPFHGNTDTPAFAVNKRNGLWICFNPSCELSGSLVDLVREVLDCNVLKAEIFIAKKKSDQNMPVRKTREVHPGNFKEFSQEAIDKLHQNFLGNDRAKAYMRGRGLDDDTLEHFQVGYSPSRITSTGKYRPEMVLFPMHDQKGMPIGVVGRSIKGKDFKNSTGLPKRFTTWNIHRARRAGGSVIVVESCIDAMRIHQAGYPNVIALLGGAITEHHLEQMERYFEKIILMTDFDWLQRDNCRACGDECRGHRPGRDLGRKIVAQTTKRVLWAAYDDKCVYPHGAKDAGDMTDDEIRQCLRNAIGNAQYRNWNIETP